MKTLSERLSYALSLKSGATQADLCRLCKVKSSSVSFWFSGKTKAIKGDMLFRVADFLNVNPKWLATGLGPMRPTESVAHHVAEEPAIYMANWPFKTITEEEWKSIPASARLLLEQQIKSLVQPAAREKIRA
jgi:transcriptional regulator with XRE-family HTH domain